MVTVATDFKHLAKTATRPYEFISTEQGKRNEAALFNDSAVPVSCLLKVNENSPYAIHNNKRFVINRILGAKSDKPCFELNINGVSTDFAISEVFAFWY